MLRKLTSWEVEVDVVVVHCTSTKMWLNQGASTSWLLAKNNLLDYFNHPTYSCDLDSEKATPVTLGSMVVFIQTIQSFGGNQKIMGPQPPPPIWRGMDDQFYPVILTGVIFSNRHQLFVIQQEDFRGYRMNPTFHQN